MFAKNKLMNAKKELMDHVGANAVKYVRLTYRVETIEGTLEEVLPKLDFEYDNGYGIQEIEGCIWYQDGTWSDRREYDGSEWWEHQACPPLPNVKLTHDHST